MRVLLSAALARDFENKFPLHIQIANPPGRLAEQTQRLQQLSHGACWTVSSAIVFGNRTQAGLHPACQRA
jgi:hypothetical protein